MPKVFQTLTLLFLAFVVFFFQFTREYLKIRDDLDGLLLSLIHQKNKRQNTGVHIFLFLGYGRLFIYSNKLFNFILAYTGHQTDVIIVMLLIPQ